MGIEAGALELIQQIWWNPQIAGLDRAGQKRPGLGTLETACGW